MQKIKFKSMRVFFLVVVMFLLISLFYFNNLKFERIKNYVYTIVIDAGSTGSRIHVYKLLHADLDNNPKTLDVKLINEEYLNKIKPGLSSYSSDPDKAALSLKPLLDNALKAIPDSYHKITKLTLKATAGLRLVSNEIADRILNNVKRLFKKYPFEHKEKDVQIMDGSYEGIYSWLTLNYALNNFDKSLEYLTCSLDLGGGSTQVTFIPTQQNTLEKINKSDIVEFKLDEIYYKIYAKSYLGYGLMSARMNIFKEDTKNFNLSERTLISKCMPTSYRSSWTQQNVEYTVRGFESANEHNFQNCYSTVLRTFGNDFIKMDELISKDIYAFSFFYDKLKTVKLVNDEEKVNTVEIQQIYDMAQSICDDSNKTSSTNLIDTADKEYAFMCMDLTYIYSLLTKGYGLPNTKKIFVQSQVNNMEISWALGAAFHLIHD